MKKLIELSLALALIAAGVMSSPASAAAVSVQEFTIDSDALCEIRDQWIADLVRENPEGTWAEMKLELSDAQLHKLGLPSSDVLASQDFSQPKMVTQDGRTFDVPLSDLEAAMGANTNEEPTLATFAGTGCLGIRPGAFYLIESGGAISLCSLAHLYGSAISTAGHCGKTGDTATVIAGTGNREDVTGVILLDFGTFGTSHDNGLGDDYALINIDSAYSSLVTPTMCFWGGPRGVYRAEGELASLESGGNPGLTVTPDPTLAQTIVHYGHGAGVGAGGTPRAGEAIAWLPDHFMFTGAIAPGDSGSGANTLLGDAVGANMQAAGIITHIWVDGLMRDGIGIMGGTRASKVGTATDGQIVPYPLPIAGLP